MRLYIIHSRCFLY